MEEVRQLVQEEGREARNLVAFHVAVDNPAGRTPRKPPRAGVPPPPRAPHPRTPARLRSASAGRDKRSELRARYWALLFGDLQRAVGELYNTVEAHENPNECQEVILVLENYTRDFKALCEWFRLKWEYESTPPPQRPQSLAWEIRKTDFVRPESRRTHSVKSSPSVSGKNSPCLSGHNTPSGKNSPNLTGKASPGSGKISPRLTGHVTSPKGSVEFFSSKIASKTATKPEPKIGKETRLSDIKEKDVLDEPKKGISEKTVQITETEKSNEKLVETQKAEKNPGHNLTKAKLKVDVELGKAVECSNVAPKPVILKCSKRTDDSAIVNAEISSQAKATIDKLDAMETEFLVQNITKSAAKNENMLNQDLENDMQENIQKNSDEISLTMETVDQDSNSDESPSKSEDNFGDISNESSKCDDKISTNKDKITAMPEIAVAKPKNGESDAKPSESLKLEDKKPIQPVIKKNKDFIIDKKKANDEPKPDAKPKELKDKPKIISQTTVAAPSAQRSKKVPRSTRRSVENRNAREKKDNVTSNDTIKKESESLKKEEPLKIDTDIIYKLIQEVKPAEFVPIEDCSYISQKDIVKYDIVLSPEAPPTKFVIPPTTDEALKNHDIKPLLDMNPRVAYSQAAAKPKIISKNEVKTPTKTISRSKTAVDIRPCPATRASNRNQKNKCSYPFNLTTGRSTLFDGGAKPTYKKTTTKPLSAGDRNVTKPDPKRPPRPTSLKINETGDKENKNLSDKDKDLDEYSSSETIVTQIDISRIESSESLKTIVPENENDLTNSIEVLNVNGNQNDNDGWLTVKSRRLSRESKKSKSHWANRFNQPSATTSLPTLNMIESPKSETNPIVTSHLDRAKSEQPQTEIKTDKVVKVNVEIQPERVKDLSMIRQKSDVTGLKTKSSRNKAIKKDKKIKDDEKLTKNRLHSSLESLTIGLARSQESTEDAFDFDKWRAEFISTFKYLEEDDQKDDTEILKTADPSEMSEIAEMTSQIEENERKISLALDFQTEVDQRKLCEEEDLLNRQIMELQQVSDIDLDTETDDTETDAEILCEDSALESCQSDTPRSLSARLEDQYETALAGMSWAERVDTLGVLEALVARDPGRAPQLHAKLSVGMRRRGSLQDALRRLQAKQARAETQRASFHTERAKKIHQLLARVEEVKVAKNQLIDEKRIRMERRLQKAAENRDQHLKDIVRKAHDEEEKLREIAFIKQLEAENRRHEFLEQCRSNTTRLREMRRERLDKLEQKSAREAAVCLRKKALEAARRQHVESLLEKRRDRDARVERRKERRKQERDDAAREKAEGVKSRLSALAAAAELEAVALRSRIRDKQDASQLRLESHLQAIREKATAGPRQPTTSESQEADKEEEEAAELERERKERERQRNIRKRARKLKQKLLLATEPVSERFEAATAPLNARTVKMHKLVTQLHNLLKNLTDDAPQNGVAEPKKEDTENNNIEEDKPSKKKKKKMRDRQSSACESVTSSVSSGGKAPAATIDVTALERILNELGRIVCCKDNELTLKNEKTFFTRVFAMNTVGDVITLATEREDIKSQLNTRLLTTCVNILTVLATCCIVAARTWLMHCPALLHCVSLLQARIQEKDLLNDAKEDEFSGALASAISVALNIALQEDKPGQADQDRRARAHAIVSFICLSGIVSSPERCGASRKTIQTLLNVIGDILLPLPNDGPERLQAQQNLRSVLGPDMFHMRNELCLLFAEGAEIAQNDAFVNAARIVHVLRALAEIDHRILQDAFGEGGWPLEFRAAIARLLSQHAPSDKEAPRKEPLRAGVIRLDAKVSNTFVMDLIELIGYVTVNNAPLRETICHNWSVIKVLCTLPANWLVSRPHVHRLLPTLLVLAEDHATRDIIAAEISLQTLQEYYESKDAQQVKMVQLLRQEKKERTKKETNTNNNTNIENGKI